MNQTDKDGFEKYWHTTFEGMSDGNYIKYRTLGKSNAMQAFLAGIQYERNRQSEVEVFLQELMGVHMRRHNGKPPYYEEWEFETLKKTTRQTRNERCEGGSVSNYCQCGGYLGSGGVDSYSGRWCRCANPKIGIGHSFHSSKIVIYISTEEIESMNDKIKALEAKLKIACEALKIFEAEEYGACGESYAREALEKIGEMG